MGIKKGGGACQGGCTKTRVKKENKIQSKRMDHRVKARHKERGAENKKGKIN